jgi:site-specific DNA recombinase
VSAGSVDTVLAQDGDRLSRKVSHSALLEDEAETHGCKLLALDEDNDDGSPEAALMKHVKRGIREYEHAKIVERVRRGRDARVRSGKVLNGRTAPYGFDLNSDRTNFIPNEHASNVYLMFKLVGDEGRSLSAVKNELERRGIPPARSGNWTVSTIRRILANDIYKPYSYEELQSEGVTHLPADDTGHYGLHKVYKNGKEGKAEYPLPVPGVGIPREWVDRTRKYLAGNTRRRDAGLRDWELKSILFCPCGSRLDALTTPRKDGRHFYYVCGRRRRNGGCEHSGYFPADKVEQEVKGMVVALLEDPEAWQRAVQGRMQAENDGLRRPDTEAETIAARLADLDRERAKNQDLYRAGAATIEETTAANAGVDKRRTEMQEELARVRNRQSRVAELEQLGNVFNVATELGNGPAVFIDWPEKDDGDPDGYKKLLRLMGITATVDREAVQIHGDLPLERCNNSLTDWSTTTLSCHSLA